MTTTIKVEATINVPIEKTWNFWTDPQHITQWNFASEDWHCPKAENDVKVGGKMNFRMEAKDGSFGFDFDAIYDEVFENKKIKYTMADGRQATTTFENNNGKTIVTIVFDAENENPVEMQQQGWQAILNNFKKYAERIAKMELLHFQININAPVSKVYNIMLNEKTYREWTAEFNPTSHYKGSWKKGSKILFIGFNKDGMQEGMVSKIRENIANTFVSIEHLGLLKGEEEVTSGTLVEPWAGMLENYTFKEINGATLLEVDMDSNEEFKSYFIETWPRALNKLKFMCESN